MFVNKINNAFPTEQMYFKQSGINMLDVLLTHKHLNLGIVLSGGCQIKLLQLWFKTLSLLNFGDNFCRSELRMIILVILAFSFTLDAPIIHFSSRYAKDINPRLILSEAAIHLNFCTIPNFA